jgi:hypothetical protein
MIHLNEIPRIGKSIATESGLMVGWDCRLLMGRECLSGKTQMFRNYVNVLKTIKL